MFEYEVVITGLDDIPLRTTRAGANALIKAFKGESAEVIVSAVGQGVPFKNKNLKITKKVIRRRTDHERKKK